LGDSLKISNKKNVNEHFEQVLTGIDPFIATAYTRVCSDYLSLLDISPHKIRELHKVVIFFSSNFKMSSLVKFRAKVDNRSAPVCRRLQGMSDHVTIGTIR